MNFTNSARRNYLDNLRWITVILVVIYHTVMIYSSVLPLGMLVNSGEMRISDSVLYFLYPWFMILLFVISGISARISLTQHPDDKLFLKKRTVRYFVPSTLGLFVFQWIQGYLNLKISNAWENLTAVPKPALYLTMSLSGTGVLWYLQMLWIFSVMLSAIRKITKKQEKLFSKTETIPLWRLLLLMIPAIGFAQILNTPVILVYRFGIYGFSFFAGYYLFAHEEIIDKLAKYSIPLLLLAILTGISYTIYFWGKNYAGTPIQ